MITIHNPHAYPMIFDIFPVGRQQDPHLKMIYEDHCEVIKDKVSNFWWLMVPGSGSRYYFITENEAKKYLRQ